MDNKQIKFTAEQELSIKHRGSSLLVSAAAGSGKTKVLVERLLSYVDDGADIDEFLVITYTRAAAFELREKIYEELLKRLSNSSGSIKLRRQALLCRGASIDTIHSICGELLRENSHLINLPPDFRIADEAESKLLMVDVADALIDTLYDKIDEKPDLRLLIDTVVEGRDDKKLVEIILDLYKKLQSLPNPGAWLKKQSENQSFNNVKDIAETIAGGFILKKLQQSVSYIHAELTRLREEMRKYPDFELKYAESVDEIISQTELFKSALTVGWDEAGRKSSFVFSKAKSISGYEDLKEIRNKCIKELKKYTEELASSSADHIKEAKTLSPAITELLSIVQLFDDAYAEEKRRRGVADFSDLEHLTLSLLLDEETGEKTGLAHSLSNRYKEIMIDEYQDVNAVQELIFSAVSKNNSNIFMVGDVKQSIYRFRQADPTIFLDKYKRFTENKPGDGSLDRFKDENPSIGRKIYLSRNFRSRAGILESVNHLFSNIMSVDFGEMDYTEKEWLVPGRDTEDKGKGKKGKPYNGSDASSAVQMNLIDMSTIESESEEESPAAIQLEARHVANEISRLTNGNYYIPDENGEERAIKCSDIVILLRSIKGRAWHFAAALSEKGIFAELPGSEGFFETVEISSILSILSMIDNPMQDIPVASVLSGPVYRFTSDELAQIRIDSKDISYYEALIRTAERETGSHETSLKCKKVLSDINEMREVVNEMTADRFIWHVYNKTGLLSLVYTMNGGEKRRRNLIRLAESARNIEKNGYKGLFGFLTYVRSLQEKGQELPVLSDGGNAGSMNMDSVRIMSIHKSKGLEFPVVFLSNTTKQFNYTDMRKSIVFHSELGIGTMLINKKLRIKHSTLARDAIKSKLYDEMLSEELRVLYVAMTRAKEKLIITATLRDAQRTISKIKSLPEGKTAPQAMMSLRSMTEWILAGFRGCDTGEMAIRSFSASDLMSNQDEDGVESHHTINKHSESDVSSGEKLSEEISDCKFEYRYNSAVDLPSKLTVTGLEKLSDPESETAFWVNDTGAQSYVKSVPEFIKERKTISATERGNAFHHVMQHIDLEIGSSDDDMSNELQRLIKMGVLSIEHAAVIDKKTIMRFLKSDIGSRMTAAQSLKREFKFSLLVPAEKYIPGGGDNMILLQGVVDSFFEEDGELVILDFKSDKVTKETMAEKVKRYTPQLDAYAYALNRITGKHIKEKIIYFLSIDTAYKIK